MNQQQTENMIKLTALAAAVRHALREYANFWHDTNGTFPQPIISPTNLADETIEIVSRERQLKDGMEERSSFGYRVPPHT